MKKGINGVHTYVTANIKQSEKHNMLSTNTTNYGKFEMKREREYNMQYTITRNATYGSLEVKFDDKPDGLVRDKLKALKFRWNGVKGVWYGYAEENELAAVLEGQKTILDVKPTGKPPKVDKGLLWQEYAKVWGKSQRMINFCVDKVSVIAYLPNGQIVPIEKQTIKTHFCFGESGYDAEDAAHMAHVARTNEKYFKEQNMKEFDEILEILHGDAKHEYSGYQRMIAFAPQYKENDKIAYIAYCSFCDVYDAWGGPVDLDEIGGKELTIRGTDVRMATKEEIQILIEAYEQARKIHEKKVDAYLKRYGTSKVESWTYWRDA